MKQYKLIEVVQNGATSEPADMETWGDKQHVTRINELASDGWHILSIHTHGESLYVYLEKHSLKTSETERQAIGFTETQKGDAQ